jgi:hypothetical protein
MSLDLEEMNRKRDRKLRYLLLSTLYLARGKSPSGGLSGRYAAEWTLPALEGSGLAFEDDEHVITLLGDLRDRGYIEMTSTANRRQGERFKLDHITLVKITAKGVDLHDWAIDADKQIDDGRAQD